MRSQEEIETVARLVGEFFDYPGVREARDPDTMDTKHDMAILEDALQWVLGNGSPWIRKMADGLLEVERAHPEISKAE
jgi:hypothetical protein